MAQKLIICMFAVFITCISIALSEEIWCDFQQSICSWNQDPGDEFDWTRRCGATSSLGTGPENGQGGLRCDKYVYIEGSMPRYPNDSARLISEPLHNVGGYCLTFWYHMYGTNIASLKVRLATEDNAAGDVVWLKTGSQGNSWRKAEFSFRTKVEGTMIVLEGIRGNGYRSDIAVDSVSILSHICPSDMIEPMTTTALHMTTMNIETSDIVTEEEEIQTQTTSGAIETDTEYENYNHTEQIEETYTEVTDIPEIDVFNELVEVVTEDAVTEFKTVLNTDPPEDTVDEIDYQIESTDKDATVVCKDNYISVEIPKENFDGADVNNLHLYDSDCTAMYNATYVTFRFSPDSCGTILQEDSDSIVYTNRIKSSETGTDGIVRKEDVAIPITCSFNKKTSVSNEFLPVFDRIAFGANGKGDFDFEMDFYKDENFREQEQDPVVVRIGDMMYFALSVDVLDSDVVLYADNCKAVPKDAPTEWYFVIQHGCMRDSTIREYPSSSAHRRLYGIEAFMFMSSGSKIVLECDLVLCDERDGISRCPTTCDASDRKKRTTTNDANIIKRSVARTIQFMSEDDNNMTDNIKSNTDWITPSSIVSMVMLVLAAILC